ncbi:MAG: hypothetical protein N2554_07530 [Fimbriimonadales bacterium]|nr:hypothetical protein [Fimbriimonadales bacterium]
MRPSLPKVRLDHLQRLLTPLGIWQHTRYAEPWVEHGFSIDDQARGLIVGVWLHRLAPQRPHWLELPEEEFPARLIEVCLHYIEAAQLENGRFHNFRDAEGAWLDEVGSEDSHGRTVWALQTLISLLPDTAWARRAQPLLEGALQHARTLRSPRALAFMALADDNHARLLHYGRELTQLYEATREPDWRWFENYLTYENPRLPQALLLCGVRTRTPEWVKFAREAFEFLAQTTFAETGYFNPVGTEGWYVRGRTRAVFDQQPVCAGATVEAFLDAWQAFDQYQPFLKYAERALMWYHGDNINQIALYDPETGVVYDGLNALGVNLNRGAESVLSYLLARIKWELYRR